jgi:hypothetical protein
MCYKPAELVSAASCKHTGYTTGCACSMLCMHYLTPCYDVLCVPRTVEVCAIQSGMHLQAMYCFTRSGYGRPPQCTCISDAAVLPHTAA